MGFYYTLQGLMWLLNNLFTLLTSVQFTGVTTNGSATVTNLSSTTGLLAGQFIVGNGIPLGTFIVAVNTTANTLTLSQNATATTSSGAPDTLWAYGTSGSAIPLYEHQLQGVVAQGPLVTWADLQEATYDGYAPQEVIYPGVISSPDGNNVVFSAQCMTWAPTDYNVGNTLTGRAVTYTPEGASGPVLIGTEVYSTPVPLSSPGRILRIIPVLPFPTNMLNTVASPILP